MSDPINDCIYLITDYGAQPGSTSYGTQNATAITAAINAALTSTHPGGIILVPPGVFYTNENIVISSGGISIRGANVQSSQLKYFGPTPSNNAFLSVEETASGIEICDLEISADPTYVQPSLNGIRWAGQNLNIDTVRLENFPGFGISVEDNLASGYCTAVGMTLNDNSTGGLQLTATTGGINFNSLYLAANHRGESTYGLLINPNNNALLLAGPGYEQAVNNVSFDNCVFAQCQYGMAVLPDHGNTANCGVRDLLFTATLCDFDEAYNAIFGDSNSTNTGIIERLMFVNCWFATAGQFDGLLIGNQSGTVIDSLGFVACRVLGNFGSGFNFNDAASNIQVSGCMIIGSQTYGVYVLGISGISGVNIVDSEISGKAGGYTPSGSIGVFMDGMSNVAVLGNNLANNGGGALVDSTTIASKQYRTNGEYNPLGSGPAITVPSGSSGYLTYSYVNETGVTQYWYVVGGEFGPGGQISIAGLGTGYINGTFALPPGVTITISNYAYNAPPTVNVVSD